jgi:hypothetical protein
MCPGFGGCGTVEKASPRCRECGFSEDELPLYGVLGRSHVTNSQKLKRFLPRGVVWLTTATLQDHQPRRERDPYRGTQDGEIGDDVAHIGG